MICFRPNIRIIKMSTTVPSCSNPDFATVLSFLEKFGHYIGLEDVSYLELESFFDGNTGDQ